MRTREPSDLGWSGLGPAGIDFDSGVGFPEQIGGAGSIARGSLLQERGPEESSFLRDTQFCRPPGDAP